MASEGSSCASCGKTGSPEKPLLRCASCQAFFYCDRECQTANWKIHKETCQIDAVELLGGDNRPFFPRARKIARNHEIFSRGQLSPVLDQVGVPLLLLRKIKEDPMKMRRDANLDNQSATYLMINPESGMAPMYWQQCVGPVIVARKDQKKLGPLELEMMWMYCDSVLDHFGDEGRPPKYSPRAFQEFCKGYKEEYILNGRTEFRAVQLPL